MTHLFVAGLFHETHTFLDEQTSLDSFEIRRGQELLGCKGDSSPMGGGLECFDSWGWNLTLGADYRATPSGTVKDEVVESFWNDVTEAWNPEVDAIFLVLHGAMTSETILDVEGDILKRFRALPGALNLSLFGVYDLHANFSLAMAEYADALVAYRNNPHTDAREASIRAAKLLRRSIETGVRPSIAYQPASLIWAPTATGTSDNPMAALESMAREIEAASESVWAANVNAGFSFADTPDTGVSFQLVTTNPESDSSILNQLVSLAEELNPNPPVLDEPLEKVMHRILNKPVSGLTVLVEPSDNIGGGAPGDMTGLLRALVEAEVSNAAICINDPQAVQSLHDGSRKIAIGGKGSRFDQGPLDLEVELISTSNGGFELEDKNSHLASMCGDDFEMGPCAVIRHKGLTILLTSRKTAPFDLGQWRSQGVDPEKLDLIVVKAAVAHRQAYDPIATRSFTVDTPGPCRSDLSQFKYVHART